ncbi:S1C family serine protease [Chloroflexota bacterium]
MRIKSIKFLLICLAIAISLPLSAGCDLLPELTLPEIEIPGQEEPTPPTTDNNPINPDWTLPSDGEQAPLLPDIASVVAMVKPSVVAINTEVVSFNIFNQAFIQEGAGSGWIIDESGIIVTNAHVVEGAESITVTLSDDRTFTAESCCTDTLTDLALIQINASDLPAATVGDSTDMRVGDWVVAIGNPLGLGISAKEGIVSRLNVSTSVSSGQTLYDLIETSAAINPGNSGGPLVNMRGEVIGITSIKIASVGVEGLGYAISSNTASPVIEELIKEGYVTRPWLGVALQDVTPFLMIMNDLSVDKGAFITEVEAISPASEAGIRTGDVIVDYEDAEINNANDLLTAIHSSQIGQEVEITYWRGDAKYFTTAELDENPPP